MGRKLVPLVIILFLMGLFATCSGASVTMKEANRFRSSIKNRLHSEVKQQDHPPPSPESEKDITNPITTVPNVIPAPFASTTPVINPTSNPETTPPATVMTPMSYPSTATAPPSLSSSWCIASQSVSQTALQVALDYACGFGGADCSAIQAGGSCYYPNSVRDHASYAFNQYYQKNPIPTSCSFGGTAVVTSTDPSSGTCRYPSTSTSSSILNTTNSSGATVFGAVPSGPTTSTATRFTALPCSLLVVSVSALLYRLFKL